MVASLGTWVAPLAGVTEATENGAARVATPTSRAGATEVGEAAARFLFSWMTTAVAATATTATPARVMATSQPVRLPEALSGRVVALCEWAPGISTPQQEIYQSAPQPGRHPSRRGGPAGGGSSPSAARSN